MSAIEPEDWDLERLQDEFSDLARENRRNAHEADKQNRRRGYYVSSIAPLLRVADADRATGTVTIPLPVWRQFCDDLVAIAWGRCPANADNNHQGLLAPLAEDSGEQETEAADA